MALSSVYRAISPFEFRQKARGYFRTLGHFMHTAASSPALIVAEYVGDPGSEGGHFGEDAQTGALVTAGRH